MSGKILTDIDVSVSGGISIFMILYIIYPIVAYFKTSKKQTFRFLDGIVIPDESLDWAKRLPIVGGLGIALFYMMCIFPQTAIVHQLGNGVIIGKYIFAAMSIIIDVFVLIMHPLWLHIYIRYGVFDTVQSSEKETRHYGWKGTKKKRKNRKKKK